MSRPASLLLAASLLPLAALPALADSYTTRVEPRPFYGATVTLEEGVRVFRPLPPTRQLVIAPQGTPVSISNHDVRVVEHHDVNVYNHGDGRGAPAVVPCRSYGGYYVPRADRGHAPSHGPAAPGGVAPGPR